MKINGAKAIITGGAGGYGKGMARSLRNAGAEVWITGRNVEKLETTAAELKVKYIRADAASGEDWDKVMELAGTPDILINNAGSGGLIAPVAEQNDTAIINTINTNLTGAILGCRRAAALMIPHGRGSIINISSVCALYAWPAWSVYTAAKAGLSKFSHGLYTELRPHGIRVCCVTPSWGQTDFNTAININGAAEDADLRRKCISPEDIGELVLRILTMPDHLAVPDVTLQPMIQDISPM